MCGIVGCFHPGARDDELLAAVAGMAATIVHRGPDAADRWADHTAGIALGFQRLAVVDTTPAGMQPMRSASGRYVVVYNGEVYNHTVLREQLSGVEWRGTSDTEVLTAAFDRWGVAGSLPRLEGMFALAVWDRVDRSVTLCRDRMGEKPLYYGMHGGALLFASELKALRAHPLFRGEVDRDALARFMYASFVPGPQSIWQDTSKLPPGTSLTITAAAVAKGALPDTLFPTGGSPTTSSARPASATTRRSTDSTCCCGQRWHARWWPTCPSVRSSPGGSTRPPSSR